MRFKSLGRLGFRDLEMELLVSSKKYTLSPLGSKTRPVVDRKVICFLGADDAESPFGRFGRFSRLDSFQGSQKESHPNGRNCFKMFQDFLFWLGPKKQGLDSQVAASFQSLLLVLGGKVHVKKAIATGDPGEPLKK